jgi:hypothetical protein
VVHLALDVTQGAWSPSCLGGGWNVTSMSPRVPPFSGATATPRCPTRVGCTRGRCGRGTMGTSRASTPLACSVMRRGGGVRLVLLCPPEAPYVRPADAVMDHALRSMAPVAAAGGVGRPARATTRGEPSGAAAEAAPNAWLGRPSGSHRRGERPRRQSYPPSRSHVSASDTRATLRPPLQQGGNIPAVQNRGTHGGGLRSDASLTDPPGDIILTSSPHPSAPRPGALGARRVAAGVR